jgi:hypothetical protein
VSTLSVTSNDIAVENRKLSIWNGQNDVILQVPSPYSSDICDNFCNDEQGVLLQGSEAFQVLEEPVEDGKCYTGILSEYPLDDH